jgi:hypothetical protein
MLRTREANLDEHVIVAMAEGSGVDVEVGKQGEHALEQGTNAVVAPACPSAPNAGMS